MVFYEKHIETPLGTMHALADDKSLYFLNFVDVTGFKKKIKNLDHKIMHGSTASLLSIERELKEYFAGNLKEFKTPITPTGSQFQTLIWSKLCKIPYGKTISYTNLAEQAKNPYACRAAGNANGSNRLAIIIPCHRVIAKDGTLGGYAGGLDRKKWLLELEGVNL